MYVLLAFCFAAEVYFELFPGSGMREMRSVSLLP